MAANLFKKEKKKFAQMLMHVIAHGGFTNAGRGFPKKDDFGRRMTCYTGEMNL